MTIVTVGIDLAKNVFAVHGVDATGKPVLVYPSVARNKLLELIAALPACLLSICLRHHSVEYARYTASLFLGL
jgi:transposase